jgi:AcrR family transcriptional regulator
VTTVMPIGGEDGSGTRSARRRAPRQERSRERIATILDVTAGLVDEVDPDLVTTTLIAERAGISVGSIYTYFDDRSMVFDAVVERSINMLYEAVGQARASATGLPWIDGCFAVVDCLVEHYRTQPGFRRLWFSPHLSPVMIDAMRRSDEMQAHRLVEQLRDRGVRLDSPDPVSVMRMYVGIIDKGLELAFRADPGGDPAAIAETKQVIRHYLEAYMRPIDEGDRR